MTRKQYLSSKILKRGQPEPSIRISSSPPTSLGVSLSWWFSAGKFDIAARNARIADGRASSISLDRGTSAAGRDFSELVSSSAVSQNNRNHEYKFAHNPLVLGSNPSGPTKIPRVTMPQIEITQISLTTAREAGLAFVTPIDAEPQEWFSASNARSHT